MITFTDTAKTHIENMLKNKGENAAFRLSIKKTGCSGYMYVPEIVMQKKENDIEISVAAFLVYIDADAVKMMQGTVVEYVKKNLGVSQLVFNNPNATGVCGCGESFQMNSDSDQ